MKRREFIPFFCGAARCLSWRAQQPERVRRVGYSCPQLRTIHISGSPRGVPAGAAEIRLDPRPQCADRHPLGDARCRRDLQIGGGNGRARPRHHRRPGGAWVGPLLQATRSVPIVFPIAGDPVGAGFVDSLARPGGNATGFMSYEYSMAGKWLELLKEIAPGVTRVAVLRDTAVLTGPHVRRHPGGGAAVQRRSDARSTCVSRRDRALRREFCSRAGWRPDPGIERSSGSAPSRSHRRAGGATQATRGLLGERLRRCRRPNVYGPDLVEQFRRATGYVDRILKGETPGDLPVQASTKYSAGPDQSQDGEDARSYRAAVAARPSQRGDRIGDKMSAIGT